MKAIESKMRKHIAEWKPFGGGNTSFVPTGKTTWGLFLHGNQIALFEQGNTVPKVVTLHGWNTITTRSRLNALDGVCVTQRNWIPYLNGKEINENDWFWTETAEKFFND